MPYCHRCGAMLPGDAAFCPRCGTALGAAPESSPSPGTTLSPNVAALLSYVLGFVTGIIFLTLEPYNHDPFVRFHAYQSIFFSAAWILFWFVWGILFVPLGILTFGFFWASFYLIGSLISLGFIILWLLLMYKAYNRERFMIPFIGEMAMKHAG